MGVTAQTGIYSEMEIGGKTSSDIVSFIETLGDLDGFKEEVRNFDRVTMQLFFDAKAEMEVDLSKLFPVPEGASLTISQSVSSLLEINFADSPPTKKMCDTSGKRYLPANMPGHGSTVESTLLGCQKRCERTPGCKYFNYFRGGLCAITHGNDGLHTHSNPTIVTGDKHCLVPYNDVLVSNHIICLLHVLLSCFVSNQFCRFPSFQEQL